MFPSLNYNSSRSQYLVGQLYILSVTLMIWPWLDRRQEMLAKFNKWLRASTWSERTEIFLFCILNILFHEIWISCWSVAYFVDTIGVGLLVFVTLVMKGPYSRFILDHEKHVSIYSHTISLWARGFTENVALFASETHTIHLSNLLVNNIFRPCLWSFDS